MASILNKKDIPLEAFMAELLFILLRISALYEYGEDGKKTGKILGYVYECVDTVNFDRFRIKIKGQDIPLMSDEDLQKIRENGEKVAVEFVEPVVKMYWNSTTKSYEDSFSAKAVVLVETE